MTCVLTCATECESDSSLSWRGGGAGGRPNTSVSADGTLRNRLLLPASSAPADELTCVVLSDGVVMASEAWRSVNSEYGGGHCKCEVCTIESAQCSARSNYEDTEVQQGGQDVNTAGRGLRQAESK